VAVRIKSSAASIRGGQHATCVPHEAFWFPQFFATDGLVIAAFVTLKNKKSDTKKVERVTDHVEK